MLSWDVGKINPQKLPSLKGTMSLQAGASKPDENPTINLQFKIQQLAISGKCPTAQVALKRTEMAFSNKAQTSKSLLVAPYSQSLFSLPDG